ncbi:MAG: hypothetical protein EOP06_01565 [Proteobacteria bacterium]|nr:MAG: hypothetical protein EOP06_01565 [Pseudomonadota bacterium]
MSFKIPFDSERSIFWKKLHLSDESLASYNSNRNVLKLIELRAYRKKSSLDGEISQAVFAVIREQFNDGSNMPCFMSWVGDKRSPFTGEVYSFTPLNIDQFINDLCIDGLDTRDKFGHTWQISSNCLSRAAHEIRLAFFEALEAPKTRSMDNFNPKPR